MSPDFIKVNGLKAWMSALDLYNAKDPGLGMDVMRKAVQSYEQSNTLEKPSSRSR